MVAVNTLLAMIEDYHLSKNRPSGCSFHDRDKFPVGQQKNQDGNIYSPLRRKDGFRPWWNWALLPLCCGLDGLSCMVGAVCNTCIDSNGWPVTSGMLLLISFLISLRYSLSSLSQKIWPFRWRRPFRFYQYGAHMFQPHSAIQNSAHG